MAGVTVAISFWLPSGGSPCAQWEREILTVQLMPVMGKTSLLQNVIRHNSEVGGKWTWIGTLIQRHNRSKLLRSEAIQWHREVKNFLVSNLLPWKFLHKTARGVKMKNHFPKKFLHILTVQPNCLQSQGEFLPNEVSLNREGFEESKGDCLTPRWPMFKTIFWGHLRHLASA